ncbi:MAG: ABC transporter ATP-binding protein [Vreelandella alkaliphila]|uniref:ABC transporter ATP-binding protein n=1 Tax=Halomonadaceae TaxID=28256 RepID=UPI000B5B30EA|nr:MULTISPECIES: ABC transporter ATP-binding protein [unclassified Halomonas]ASK20363.1 cobalamin/Fe(3+)-siderophore ABC transporter ATP-binding protein [Halomonas sp. N3-2A]UTD55884.1 ABC transporter ATP-binding protein [Halomonas sp. MS1]HBP42496.1 ABC transporter ATP-binding protein [Halomonas sp.]
MTLSSCLTPRLRGESLHAGYEDKRVLDGVDIGIQEGKLTVLLGPNGSGKSTLLKTLARTLTPSAGHVYLDGKDIHRSNTREVAQRLGILPQGPVAPEGLSVQQLVGMGRFPHQRMWQKNAEQDARAIREAMAYTNVTEFAERNVDALSGGQRQRCWIAMVLAQQTDLILLDEPTTFLDLKVQVDLLALLSRLAHEHGRTLLLVLHDLNLAAAYADQLIMMRDGKIITSGTPSEIFTAANLKRVFDLDAHVLHDPVSNSPVCVPHKFTANTQQQHTDSEEHIAL